VVDELAGRHAADRWARLPLCELTSARFGSRLLLAKPLTFMNRSGAALAWLLDHLELDLGQALVVADDVDLSLGVLRLRRAGSAGTTTACATSASTSALPSRDSASVSAASTVAGPR